jgi:hypothetical protein
MKKKLLAIPLFFLTILLVGCNQVALSDDTLVPESVAIADKMMQQQPTPDKMMEGVDTEKIMQMTFDWYGELTDVTAGKNIQGIITKNNAKGIAKASFTNEKYALLVTFENLPEPQGTDFYEGWIVRKGINFDVISTGKAVKVEGAYVNSYMSSQDLTDHTFYVLTIEPDDGNPAPAGHILEGTLT